MSSSTIRPPASRRATLDDLMKVEGKAELIGGRIVQLHAHGSPAESGRRADRPQPGRLRRGERAGHRLHR